MSRDPLPAAEPHQMPSGAWVLRVVIAGHRVRLPVASKGATSLEVARAHKSILAQWDAIVARFTAGLTKPSEHGPTFADVANDWTSGRLAQLHPDHVRRKRSVGDDKYRLAAHVLPHVGSVPVASFTIEHAEGVMAELDPELSTASRRHVAQLMSRVMAMAVYPLKLVAATPLPKGFLPKLGARVALSWAYPSEDAALMATESVPLVWRVLWGFMAREGMRLGEASALLWSDIDMKNRTVKLDENKTDEPRVWALGADVHIALDAWRKLSRSTGLVFAGDGGVALKVEHAADLYREHLRAAGVDRAELFERSKTRRPVRAHDLRASFASVALATGRSETWCRDRTGHQTSDQLERYRRQARSAAELGMEWFSPLDRAIPGLVDPLNRGHDDGHEAAEEETRKVVSNRPYRYKAEVAEWQTRRIQNPLS